MEFVRLPNNVIAIRVTTGTSLQKPAAQYVRLIVLTDFVQRRINANALVDTR